MAALFNFRSKQRIELDRSKMPAPQKVAGTGEPERTCPHCRRTLPESSFWSRANTCVCGYHFRISARERISIIADEGSFKELFGELEETDPIGFPGYAEKLEKTAEASGAKEAVICGTVTLGGREICLFIMDPTFMMGSMGTVVGERITSVFEYATEKRLPVVGFTVSGGARMQEGLFSLMQMAKTSGAVKRHSDAGLFYLTVLTDPTTGGVTASFAMEGDIILAEPGATVGFAGARVIEQTTGKALPAGFQTSEFILEHGFADAIVPRTKQREVISRLISMHCGGEV